MRIGLKIYSGGRGRMNDAYWWLKANGQIEKISYEKYHELLGGDIHLLAHSHGVRHIILSKDKNVLYCDADQLFTLLKKTQT